MKTPDSVFFIKLQVVIFFAGHFETEAALQRCSYETNGLLKIRSKFTREHHAEV